MRNSNIIDQKSFFRYTRQIVLPDFGKEGQLKLANASVLVIGCGGLGGPALLFLTAAGVGKIGIVEFDTVSESNLHRQILFDESDIGKSKAIIAKGKLSKLNSSIEIIIYNTALNSTNALKIIESYDVIVDCSDNFPTRYLVNDACEILQKPFVYAAIHQFEAQLAVFNLNGSASYRDLYSQPPPPHMAPDCSTAGVFGALAGTIGSMQSLEAIKIITGIGKVLSDNLMVMDFKDMIFRKIRINKVTDRIKPTELIDYEDFCGIKSQDELGINKETFLKHRSDFELIDIRPAYEHEIGNLGEINLEAADLEGWINDLNPNKKYLLYCTSGKRSKVLAEKIKGLKTEMKIYYLDAEISDCW